MWGYHLEFGVSRDHESSPSSLLCCGFDVVASNKFIELVDACPNVPYVFAYVFIKGHILDYAKMDLVENLLPSIVKDKPCAYNEHYFSDYYRFSRVLLVFFHFGQC